eukprot:SAG31_NODE_4193_length_3486_cov_2.794804_5_plen_62_part_00
MAVRVAAESLHGGLGAAQTTVIAGDALVSGSTEQPGRLRRAHRAGRQVVPAVQQRRMRRWH